MDQKDAFRPQKFAVVGAGPVGCIVAAFLARQGHDVTLCDVIPELIEPAIKTGIVIEGAENLQQTVSRVTTSIDDLGADPPDVIFITVKANANALIASAIEGFHREVLYVFICNDAAATERVFADVLGDQPVMRAVVNYGCGLVAPGHVRMPFHHPPHYLQELDPQSAPAARAIADALTGAVWRLLIPTRLFRWSGARPS